MWLQIFLCLGVSLAHATTNPAWRENSEYVYEVRGRTVTGLHEISDQYSGLECKTTLKIQPRSDGVLQAKILNSQCAQIHMPLSDTWRTHIPDSELAWNTFPLSSEPFQIIMENGAVKGVSVHKGISNWEANMIKGIVSQFQLRIAERPSTSEEFLTPFRVREDTVTGNTETFYKIMKMPDHMIQKEFNSHRLMEEKRNEEVYEVTKHKNYTNSVELPSYFYGFAELEDGFPATNQMGSFLSRGSFSRAILTGSLNRFTIQNTLTVSQILVNPTLNDNEKGSVYSMVNATLISVGKQDEKIEDVRDSVYLDNLVYSYGKPFDSSNEVRQRNPAQSFDKHRLAKYHTATNLISRLRRSLEETDFLPGSEESYKQEHPKLHEAPESPLLRFTIGNKGQSIKQKMNVVHKVKELSEEIAEELQDYSRSFEKQSLYKFSILTSLVRVMDANEMKTAGDDLFNNAKKENEQDPWKIYRDSVAQSGTGPALLAIKEWIESGRIGGIEASLVLSTMSRTVRQPSVQYMKTYFELIKNPKIRSNWPVNDTAILSFSNLVREVYVEKKHSDQQFPVKSFKNFRNEDGMELMNETIIPYLSEQLHRAISQAETHKIHLYIRALGNIGEPQILAAFEPYLEGDKQASQFQRLLMVLAMDNLAVKFPEHARSALVRLYHNNAETEEIRVAAVYQIMRSRPSPELLQYMASYTNFDKHEHVVAAVKSALEQISKLEGFEFSKLRRAAEAAKPLLTKKAYGIQFGGDYLHQHVIEELNYKYKDVLQVIGSEDEYYPKGMKFSLHSSSAGLSGKLMNVQAMVSSVKVLTYVLREHMSSHTQHHQQQNQKYSSQMQHQYSSQKIAEILGLQSDEQEQLEGNFYFEDEALNAMLPFDNQTIHKIIKELTKFEIGLQRGQQIRFLKMFNTKEMAIAFPTEMGLPFLYTFDTPVMIRVQGRVKASASPKISQEKLQVPEHVQIDSDLTLTWTSKVQGHISFITPHDHQQYVSGYSKNTHIHVPLNGRLEMDIKKMQVKAEFERGNSQQPSVLFHHSTTPYVSRLDILKFDVPKSNPNTRIIQQNTRKAFEKDFGRKETGLVVRLKVDQEKPFVDLSKVKDLFSKDGIRSVLVGLMKGGTIQKSEITVTNLPQESTSKKCEISLTYRGDRKDSESLLNDRNEQDEKSQLDRWQSATPEQRQSDILQKITRGIKNFKADAVDVSIEFKGEENIKYTMLGAYVRSHVDPVSRVTVLYRQRSDKQSEEPYAAVMNVENVVVNANGPNLEHSMQNKPEIKSKIQISFGSNPERFSVIHTQLAFTRSQEREQYLEHQPMYKQCRAEMKEGNNLLQACTNASMASNLLDRIDAKVQYRNIPMEMKKVMRDLFYAAKYRYYPSVAYEHQQGLGSDNELTLQAKFDPDLRSVNVSVTTENQRVKFESIVLNQWVKPVVILHPVFNVKERVMVKAFEFHTYKPFCVIDKTKISTFNNKTFPADVSDKWTVMFQYIPKVPRFTEDIESITQRVKRQTENFVVLVRADPSRNGKDVKLTINSPETKFEVLDITMTPRQQQGEKDARAKVTVNDKEMQVDENRSYDYEHGYIQIHTLPTGDVKVEVKDQFNIIYDGERVTLGVSNGKFKDATRGICGQFNEEKIEDFLTPENCYVQDHQTFIKSFEIEGSEGQKIRQELKSDSERKCVKKSYPFYVDVVSSRNKQSWQKQNLQQCTAFQTQYVQQNGEVCFTLRPIPKCVPGCQSTSTIERDVPVHCLQKSNIVQHWKNQIDNGVNLDFSKQTESKTVNVQIPESCI